MKPLDIDTVDPGVQRLVKLLRAHGHETTDSGDGFSRPEDERTMGDLPHVHVRPLLPYLGDAAAQSVRIVGLLQHHGVQVAPGMVQVTWDPLSPSPVISIVGVADEHLREDG